MAKESVTRYIKTVGGLLPSELLQRITTLDQSLDGLKADEYHLAGERIPEAISRSWGRMLAIWANFQSARSSLAQGDAATGITREKLLFPLFNELGYGRLPVARGLEIDGKAFPISHLWNQIPIHLVGTGVDLDRRTAGAVGAARQSPHGLMQEYLNRSDALWGIVGNGLRLRLLRDNATLTRQAYVEFDLEALLDAEAYPDFAILWMLLHESRLFSEGKAHSECWLENWQQQSAEQGKRALNQLRAGVGKALNQLGSGFLAHPANTALKNDLRSGALSPQDYYRQLLRLVYRLLFLFVAEDRDSLLEAVGDGLDYDEQERLEQARKLYTEHYSTARLRLLAERIKGTQHADLYQAHRLVAGYLSEGGATPLALKPLDSFLFNPGATPHLSQAELSNRDFLEAVRSLAFTLDGHTLRPVDYKNLGAEELGSIYEQLLELVAEVNIDAAHFELKGLAGNERKTSGSYYTPTSLIEVVLDEALKPVLDRAVALAKQLPIGQRDDPILSLKVVDPAVGSGHFLIAAAHRIAKALAQLRSGEDEPSPQVVRSALRDVIRNCLYGVDINEMSAELCKVALWIESADPGKPLGFIDHHIKVGNSLIGAPPQFYNLGVPVEAHKREDIPAEVRKASSSLSGKKLEEWRKDPGSVSYPEIHFPPLALPEDTLQQVATKQRTYQEWQQSEDVQKYRFLADYWTAAWFATGSASQIPGHKGINVLAQTFNKPISEYLAGFPVENVNHTRTQYGFFHWWLEFPEVFFDPSSGKMKPGGGFDVVLGNPPWERVKLQEKEFFAGRDSRIAEAENASKRKQLIQRLQTDDPALYQSFVEALNRAENVSGFLRTSGRYPLTGGGDVNTYQVFSEHNRNLVASSGYAGIIVPTGIATDDSNKEFFADLVAKGRLGALLDFENRDAVFPGVHRSTKFCILALRGSGSTISTPAKLTFFATQTGQLADKERIFSLTPLDFALLNPNTRTCPTFRTRSDADLTKKIYRRVPILWKEAQEVDEIPDGQLFPDSRPLVPKKRTLAEENPWGIKFARLFDMSNDSSLFRTASDLERDGYVLEGNIHYKGSHRYLPLYEAKLIHQFDHRFATYDGSDTCDLTLDEHTDPERYSIPRYWVSIEEVEDRLVQHDKQGQTTWEWQRGWLLGFRDIARATDERTAIFSVMPRVGVGHKAPLVFPTVQPQALMTSAFLANMSSLTLDFCTRQKVGGTDISYHRLKQFPVLPPQTYQPEDLQFIVPRVLELTYTAWDLAPFALDVWNEADEQLRQLLKQQWHENGGHPDEPPAWVQGYPFTPFIWNEDRRAVLRAELDAYFARLYGLERDDLQYILYPQSVKGDDFPGETFRVLRDKEIKAYNEYRTMRLVLEAWDRLGYPPSSK